MADLASLLESRLWRESAVSAVSAVSERSFRGERGPSRPTLGTGHPNLDRALPGGGWPLGAVTEILCDHHGIGEIGLLSTALAALTRRGRWVVWVGPPHVPYAPALAASGLVLSRLVWVRSEGAADRLWAAEQALRHPDCGAVLLWLAEHPREDRVARRLQLAAESAGTWSVVFRPGRSAARASAAALRLALEPDAAGTRVRILKCRGRAPARAPVRISMRLAAGHA